MAKLIYIANTTLDGYVEDADGGFGWTEPSEEVFAFITDLIRPMGVFLYGRRMYETMAVWETDPTLGAESELMADFADLWQAADKVVYSTTLPAAFTARTRLERNLDLEALAEMKASTATDLGIGGSIVAAQAFDAGLVDECHLFVYPVLLGRGKPAFGGNSRVDLELMDEHRFPDGALYLRYRTVD